MAPPRCGRVRVLDSQLLGEEKQRQEEVDIIYKVPTWTS